MIITPQRSTYKWPGTVQMNGATSCRLDEKEIQQLSQLFGIPAMGRYPLRVGTGRAYEMFLRSAAFDALGQWVADNPKIAKKLRDANAYFPVWYERATRRQASLPVGV